MRGGLVEAVARCLVASESKAGGVHGCMPQRWVSGGGLVRGGLVRVGYRSGGMHQGRCMWAGCGCQRGALLCNRACWRRVPGCTALVTFGHGSGLSAGEAAHWRQRRERGGGGGFGGGSGGGRGDGAAAGQRRPRGGGSRVGSGGGRGQGEFRWGRGGGHGRGGLGAAVRMCCSVHGLVVLVCCILTSQSHFNQSIAC